MRHAHVHQGMTEDMRASKSSRSKQAPARRKMLSLKQAEHLANAIELGLIESAEQRSGRVQEERRLAKEEEQRRNRRMATVLNHSFCTWPAGGAQFRIRQDYTSTQWHQKEYENPLQVDSPWVAPLSPSFSASKSSPLRNSTCTSPRRSVTAYQSTSRKLASPIPYQSNSKAGSDADATATSNFFLQQGLFLRSQSRKPTFDRFKKALESPIDQEPWRRVVKPRALTDEEQAHVMVYRSQPHLFSRTQLLGGGVALRPLSPVFDLVQLQDVIKADFDTLKVQAENSISDNIAAQDAWLLKCLLKRVPPTVTYLQEQLLLDEASAWFAIVDPATGRTVGVISIIAHLQEALRVEILRIILPPSLRSSVVVEQALSLLMGHLFDTMRFMRIQISCCASLLVERSQLLDLGWKFEGCKRAVFYTRDRSNESGHDSCAGVSSTEDGRRGKEQSHDVLVFRMLDSDWKTKGRSSLKTMIEARPDSGTEFLLLWNRIRSQGGDWNGVHGYAHAAAKLVIEQMLGNVSNMTFNAVLAFELEQRISFGREKVLSESVSHAIPVWNGHPNRMGELVGRDVILQTIEAHGGKYEGWHKHVCASLSSEEARGRYAEPSPFLPQEWILQQYLWKLQHSTEPSAFALRVGVKGDGHPRKIISRADLATAGFMVARTRRFPCIILEMGPLYLEQADELVRSEALQLLFDHAFAAGMQRIELLIDPAASRTCLMLIRLGFFVEAIHRQWYIDASHVHDVVRLAVRLQDRTTVTGLQARQMHCLHANEQSECILPESSFSMQFSVAFPKAAIGVEFSDTPPLFVKSIHPSKGVGLPSVLVHAADAEQGPYLVAIEEHQAHGMTRKEVLALLRTLPRPVTLHFRSRAGRMQAENTQGTSGYKATLGVRNSLITEMVKRHGRKDSRVEL